MCENLVKVWRFADAPARYRSLSNHGDDEDWLTFIPIAIQDEWFGWMAEGTSFGSYSVSEHFVRNDVVRIGAHA